MEEEDDEEGKDDKEGAAGDELPFAEGKVEADSESEGVKPTTLSSEVGMLESEVFRLDLKKSSIFF